jgi:hypothetical protein
VTVRRDRRKIAGFADNPTLKSPLDELMTRASRRARTNAERETHLVRSTFPPDCPFTVEQTVDPNFWPD